MLSSVSNVRLFKLTIVKGGEKIPIDFDDGTRLFDAVAGTKAESLQGKCGGSQVCGECKCQIPQKLYQAPDEDEKELLAGAPANSRLACNLTLTAAFDGAEIQA